VRVLHGRGRPGDSRLTLVAAAARNNADWCDGVCRAQGIEGRFERECWSSPRRTPPHYPDAVTLVPGVAPDLLLARVDAGDGCSVKDSFADVDLGPFGFRELFRAQWIALDELPSAVASHRGSASATCSAGVIGLTNAEEPEAWLGAAAAARERWGPRPVVGYERGPALSALLAAGFRSIGPLTVWIR
jgi:hypothetical protein